VNVALDVDDELIVGVIVFVFVLTDVLLTVDVIVDVFDIDDDPDTVSEICPDIVTNGELLIVVVAVVVLLTLDEYVFDGVPVDVFELREDFVIEFV